MTLEMTSSAGGDREEDPWTKSIKTIVGEVLDKKFDEFQGLVIAEVHSEFSAVREEIQEQKRRIIRMSNIVMMGVPETTAELQIAKDIVKIIAPGFSGAIVDNRIGDSSGRKPRPLRISFHSAAEKNAALSMCKKLAGIEVEESPLTVLDAESGYGNCFHALFSRRLSRLYVSGIGERWDRLDAAWAIAIVQIVRGDPRRKAYFYATQKFRRKSKVVFNVEGPIRLKTVEPVFISSTATILLAFISLIVEIRSGYPAHSRKLKCEIVSIYAQTVHMCLPFDFDEGSNRLVGARSVRQIRMSQFQCVLSTFYCFAMFLLLAIGGLSTTEKFQASPFFMLNLLACIVRWSNVIGNDAIQIINSFLEFEHSTVKAISSNTGTTPVAKAMKYFIALILISLRIISIMQMTLFLFAPCTVPFIVSMSVECRGIRTGLGPSRWIGHILDTWILSHGCYSAAIPVLFVLCVGIVCFLTYFDVLTRLASADIFFSTGVNIV
ncbi:hypothetical protein Fcan01_00211 [Folsomia candida]|uniref:Uncharacterized protein n=1 Tax=Folsomia candida TaxID=158441 RepID=A0A226F037_FOLCA|nr:hypothetical protein Fcan01_00211 [Folsomia candida]